MVCYFEDAMISFLLVLLESIFKSGLCSHDRDYSPASSLETGRVQGRLCIVYVEGLAEQVFLFGESSDDCVFHSVPADVVRVELTQPFTVCVQVGCAVGSLHPFVHAAS